MFKLIKLDFIYSFITNLLDFSLIFNIILRLDILVLRLVVNLLNWLSWDVFLIDSHSWTQSSLNLLLIVDFLVLVLILVFVFVNWLSNVFFRLVLILCLILILRLLFFLNNSFLFFKMLLLIFFFNFIKRFDFFFFSLLLNFFLFNFLLSMLDMSSLLSLDYLWLFNY